MITIQSHKSTNVEALIHGSKTTGYDAAVIGGGVVGCAVCRRLALEGAKVVLLERAPDILAGASKGSSAILHTGFDAPANSLELACIRAGRDEYLAIYERLGLSLLETGALVIAWEQQEAARLTSIREQAQRNGVVDVALVEQNDLRRLEPMLSEKALMALRVPGEHVIDPWSAPLAYLMQAVEHGAEMRRDTALLSGSFDGRQWRLETTGGPIIAGTAVNCAGLYGDRVEAMLMGDAHFEVKPRKGQFVVFDKAASRLVSHILLPVPSERSKGIVVTRTAFGNLLVGPTAEDQEDRDDTSVDEKTLRFLIERAVAMVPALADMPVTATYAGLRPASEQKAYRIRHEPDRRFITVGGIRSTGLTAALGLAQHVTKLCDQHGLQRSPVNELHWPVVANLTEHRQRDWQRPAHGDIVCHCEMVTRREIEAALSGPLPAGDLGGLKRRTRCMMGRCQGFYCAARIASITEGRLGGHG